MTVAASTIISRVRTQLIDTGVNGAAQRWSDTELLQWLSDGQRTVVQALPRASSKLAVFKLVAGTRQTIPADGYVFLTSYRNMGTDGLTPGQATMMVPRQILDAQYLTWHSDTGSNVTVAFTYDESDQLAFYVYPQSLGNNYLEVLYSMQPPEMATTADLLVVRDIYATPLFDYVMWRALEKDSDYGAGMASAQAHFQAFGAFLATNQQDALTNQTQADKN